ncbi:MAG: 4-hydroxy-tetrahydrodipicolinate reductase [Vitreimonas sp.]
MTRPMTLALAIAGCNGRMGRALIDAAGRDARFSITGTTTRGGTSANAAGANADVWIDFTTPDATIAALDALSGAKVRAAVIGTTGLSPAQEDRIVEHAKRIAIVRSGNFSLGVNLLAALVEDAASKLSADWDIEIFEAHHRRKVDAPSGTAVMLGEAAAQGRSQALKDVRLPPNTGITGARKPGGIGFASLRAGGIIGEHEVMFATEREVLTLSHSALDRGLFADGALAAALWAADKTPGLYTMRNVLGL